MKTRVVSIWLCLSLLLVLTPFSLASSATAKTIPLDEELVPDGFVPVTNSRLQEGQPGDPVVTGELGLNATVQVLPYDVDIYGIYLVQGDEVSLVTSVAVDHINVDRITAKLSPDGYKVAYLVEYGYTGFSRLVVVGIDGLTSSTLFEASEPGQYITSFAWAHDSEQLAFALSRDPFGSAPDAAAAFENPDIEVNPLEVTLPFADPLELTGEVWVTDLHGAEQEQIIDCGAMDVLGWATDDSGIYFTRIMTTTPEAETGALLQSDGITITRNITPTSTFAAAVSLVRSGINDEVTDLVTNTLPISSPVSSMLHIGFYLLEDNNYVQRLAVVSTLLPFETSPITDTILSVFDISTLASGNRSLSSTAVLTNTDAIVSVSLSPDGSRLAYMTEREGGLWTANANGLEHTAIITSGLSANVGVMWSSSAESLAVASLDSYEITVFNLNGATLGTLSVLPSEDLLAEPLNAQVQKQLSAPYIHQLWDTPDWFGGYCACGPTSTAMALAFYNKIARHPIQISVPYPHANDFGFYVAERYGDHFQNRWAWDCNANLVGNSKGYGLYGFTMVSQNYRAAEYSRVRDALAKHGLTTTQDWTPTFDEVKAAIDRGHLVIMGSTKLTKAGHIVLVVGYTNDGRLVVHDPYGNFRNGTYGRYDGANSWYYWNDFFRYGTSSVFNFIEVHGTPPSGGGGCGGGTPTITHWKGAYFNNLDLSGQPALVRNDNNPDFNWGAGSPSSGCINADNFSVRWTRTLSFDRGVYRFRTTTDDGVRLYVDNNLIINKWQDQASTTYQSGDVFLDGGNHSIRMEYYERGGAAVAKLSWERVGGGSSGTGWYGEYYNNRTLSGSPAFTRNDSSVYFNWDSGSPGSNVGSDNFSVRWTRTLNVPRSGYYRFYARSDDGVRVWVNGQLRINAWRDQAPTTYASDWLYLNEGVNSIKVEYYERGGGAYIRVWMVPGFYTRFYNNRDLAGSPSYTTHYSGVYFNWGLGGPPNTSANNFSARWIGHAALSGGRYKFCVRTDDGVRLYIDGTRVINKWQDQGATTYCTDRDLARGFHEIKMEYYENGGFASAELWWSRYNGSDALAASVMLFEEPTEFDIWALYGDSGYLGPLVESDITTLTVVTGETVFLPLVLRQP